MREKRLELLLNQSLTLSRITCLLMTMTTSKTGQILFLSQTMWINNSNSSNSSKRIAMGILFLTLSKAATIKIRTKEAISLWEKSEQELTLISSLLLEMSEILFPRPLDISWLSLHKRDFSLNFMLRSTRMKLCQDKWVSPKELLRRENLLMQHWKQWKKPSRCCREIQKSPTQLSERMS